MNAQNPAHHRGDLLVRSFLGRSHRQIVPILIIIVLLIAFGVRVHQLGTQSLWHDEGNSYVQATRSLGAIADNASRDIHPPGYYWLLHVWRGATGDSEFALRSLSTFASLLSVAFAFAIGKRLVGGWMGAVAAVFVALNTFSIFYAQEARMYALLAMWAGASMWVFAGFMLSSSPSKRRTYALALAVLNLSGLFTQYAYPFVMIAQGALVMLWLWSSMRVATYRASALRLLGWFIIANVLTIVLYAPWLGTAWSQVTTWPSTGETVPFAQALSTIIAWLSFGLTHQSGTTVTVAFFLLFGLLNFSEKPDSGRVWWRILVPVVWVAVTVGAFLALGLFREANLKFMLPAQLGFALWMARGMWVLWTVRVKRANTGIFRYTPKVAAVFGVLVITVGLLEGLNPLYNDPTYQRDDYRGIVAEITAGARDGDAIILSAPNQQEVFDYYYTDDASVYPLPHGLGGDDDATLSATQAIIAEHDRIFAVLWATGERDPNNIVEATLDSEAFEADSRWFGDVRLVRYASPVTFDDVIDANVRFGESIILESYALSAETVAMGDVLQVQLVWSTDAPLDRRYKVFLQLLAPDGFVVTQRDAEPGGGLALTTTWAPETRILDNHALIVPNGLTSANYNLIIGLYDVDDAESRLPVGEGDFLELSEIQIR